MDHVTIRSERDGDEPGIAAAHIAAWLASVESDGARVMCVDEKDWIQQRRIRLAGIDGPTTLVAEVGDAIVGHLTWGRGPGGRSAAHRIWSCYVDPSYWGSGVACRLITVALAELAGVAVDLEVYGDNLRARRFYERHGFRNCATSHTGARGLIRYLTRPGASGLHAAQPDGTICVCSRASSDLPAPGWPAGNSCRSEVSPALRAR